ncbi:MAG: ribonuclease III [Bdellovibrio sp.]|nr:MAG: ribonuclease III [Bdellovibrio sp.]
MMTLKFSNPQLLDEALTHKSFFYENRSSCLAHNERLEFLGDAVLDLCLTDCLMKRFPQKSEGQLSKIRAGLVNESQLSQLAKQLNLQEHLKLGKGEQQSGGREKSRLLASTFEAVVGAYYLDAGFEKTFLWVEELFAPFLKENLEGDELLSDYKTQLQEKVQRRFKQTPYYRVLGSEGPDHQKKFHVGVFLDNRQIAEGQGRSKKMAEQKAAQKALEKFDGSV